LERQLSPEAMPAMMALATTLGEASPALLPRLQSYLGATAAAHARRLTGSGRRPETAWTDREIAELLRLSLLDPPRFVDDPGFRERALGVLAQSLDKPAPAALRDRLLDQLGGFPGFDFAAGERVGWAWGALPRRSSVRRLEVPAGETNLRFDADDAGDGRSLAASVYSLPSTFFDPASATAFLTALRALGRERRIVVLVDLPLARALGERTRALDVDLLLNHGRPYSPWPRDPFSLVHSGDGKRVVVLVRPNLQPGREEDANLGPELVQDLPPALDTAWGEPRVGRAPVPFHNGQVLLTAKAAWISLHTLEPRILALLGESRVPVESFATAAGIDRYLGAARRAAAELARLYGRPVRFVHPLPEGGPLAAREARMTTLGGGAGYDLDSILTLLPAGGPGAPPHALVADVAAGRALLSRLSPADGPALAKGYGLMEGGLPAALAAAQDAPRPRALAPFLDLLATQLQAAGFAVDRLPLLFVPVSLLSDRALATGLGEPDFLLTWNNVVVERRGNPGTPEIWRAEGFSMLLPEGDDAARAAFTRAGVHLDLLPPLVPSIVRNGGYRCASNHLRR